MRIKTHQGLLGRVGDPHIFVGYGPQGPQGAQGPAGTAGGSVVENNTTNPSLVATGQLPATLIGSQALVNQSCQITLTRIAGLFLVELGNQGNYFQCATAYGSTYVSAQDDPGALFTTNPLGSGIYVYKLIDSNVINFKNLTGATNNILIQVLNDPNATITPWS